MKNILKLSVVFLSLAVVATDGNAQAVHISGIQTRVEIKAKCEAAGGEYHSTGNKNGFGCDNQSKDTSMTCDPKGHCIGYVPD